MSPNHTLTVLCLLRANIVGEKKHLQTVAYTFPDTSSVNVSAKYVVHMQTTCRYRKRSIRAFCLMCWYKRRQIWLVVNHLLSISETPRKDRMSQKVPSDPEQSGLCLQRNKPLILISDSVAAAFKINGRLVASVQVCPLKVFNRTTFICMLHTDVAVHWFSGQQTDFWGACFDRSVV